MSPAEKSPRLSVIAPVLVFAAAAAAFLPILGNGFVTWDDVLFFTQNPAYRGLDPSHLRWMFSNVLLCDYQPLAWITLGLDYSLWGMEPGGYHLQSLLWHAGGSVLVFYLARRLLELARGERAAWNDAGALIAALLFAVHPLRTEAVAWASERRELVGDFFWFLGALLYLRAGARRAPPLAGTLVCFGLALLAKGTMVSLPLVLLALDYYPLRRLESLRGLAGRALEKWMFAVLAVPFVAVGVWAAARQGEDALSFAVWSPAQRLAQIAFGAAFYARKSLWPSGLAYLYYMPRDLDPLAPRYVLSALAVVLAAAAAWRLRRRFPAGLAALAAYAAALFPVVGVLKYGPQLAADRYSNLACLPLVVLAGAFFAALLARARGAARAGVWDSAGALVVGLGVLARAQAGTWRDSLAMWSRAREVEPDDPLTRGNLGTAAAAAGDFARAESELRSAAGLAPGSELVVGDWGTFLGRRGRWAESAAVFEGLSGRLPRSARARAGLALALARLGRTAEAESRYRESLALDPRAAETRYGDGVLLLRLGRKDEARAQFEAAASLDPALAEAQVDLGLLLSESGRRAQAYERFRAALRSESPATRALAHYDWGNALCDEGRLAAALGHFREAVRLDPDLLEARFNLGNTLARERRYAEAAAAYRALLARAPAHAGARRGLAAVLALSRRR